MGACEIILLLSFVKRVGWMNDDNFEIISGYLPGKNMLWAHCRTAYWYLAGIDGP